VGIGPSVGAVWVFICLFSLVVYAFRYRHDQRLVGNTVCIAFLVVSLLGFVGLVAVFPQLAFDASRGAWLFSALFFLVPMACIGVLVFSILEWRMARSS